MSETAAETSAAPTYEADPYEYREARELMESLDLAEPVAITLVRRGHRTPEQARSFLEARIGYEPSGFEGIRRAAGLVAEALAGGEQITVHGDYDVDGIAATAILVAALRRAGGEVDWLIPDRAADGYGLTLSTVERLGERGTRLLITADCGITSVEEVAAARAAGIEVVVTDHHRPGPELPDCSIVHPEVNGYPFAGLCGAAVAHKFAAAFGDPEAEAGRDLDLVALATVADLVPLVDENRTLARRGIAELRRARRPGVRALVEAAGVEPEHLDEGDIAFRLAPRLNAAGRLYRADAGVELLLSEDRDRARAIAAELDAVNRERRDVERELNAAAAAAYRELGERGEEALGVVLAGPVAEGWHPGVVGIAASRMAERLGRPVILLAIDERGGARGSGRSIPGFDLLEALERCAPLLDRYGGHRAAAGLELAADRIEGLREAFAAAARAQLPEGPVAPRERIDAVVGAEALDLAVAEQLDGLGPFGRGNPPIRLLLPWAQVDDVRPMGRDGRHARFSVRSGSARAGAVAFNAGSALEGAKLAPRDITVRLELNHWNGAVEPRAVLDRSRDELEVEARCGCPQRADAGWWRRFEEELAVEPGLPSLPDPAPRGARERIEQSRRSPVALISELLSSGSPVLAVTADARRRARLASPAASPARFGGSHEIVCGSCPTGQLAEAAGREPDLLLTDWEALAGDPGVVTPFTHIVVVDPPPLPYYESALESGSGWLHLAWGRAGELPALCWEERWQPRDALAEIYRALVPESRAGARLGELLAGGASLPRSPLVAARCVRVLAELGIAELGGRSGDRELRVVSSEKTELRRSAAWRAYATIHEEGLEYLQSRTAS